MSNFLEQYQTGEPSNPYELANAMIKDAGFDPRNVGVSDYGRMINAIRNDNFDISIGKGTGKSPNIIIDGIMNPDPADARIVKDTGKEPQDCPSWMPANLCGSYAHVAGAVSTSSTGVGAVARILGFDDVGEAIDEYSTRAAFIILGIILIALSVYFIFKGPVDQAAMTAAKAIL